MSFSPPFGHADLSNCERELIHLAGSIQPHGILIGLRADSFRITQVSDNIGAYVKAEPSALLEQPLSALDQGLESNLRSLVRGVERSDRARRRRTHPAEDGPRRL